MQAKDDGYDRWWDLDLAREEETELKLVWNMLLLVLGCGSLAYPFMKLWHPTKGTNNRFHMGVLIASLFMFGNMVSKECDAVML